VSNPRKNVHKWVPRTPPKAQKAQINAALSRAFPGIPGIAGHWALPELNGDFRISFTIRKD